MTGYFFTCFGENMRKFFFDGLPSVRYFWKVHDQAYPWVPQQLRSPQGHLRIIILHEAIFTLILHELIQNKQRGHFEYILK